MNTFFEFVRPSMLELARGVDIGVYRREPCFRQHLEWCLSKRLPSHPGKLNWALKLEVPTTAQYMWTGRDPISGRLDSAILDLALELNFNYLDAEKIRRDLIKLVDQNGFAEAAYLVFGRTHIFRNRIEQGFRDALAFLMGRDGVVLLSKSLHIVVVEDLRGRRGNGSLHLWEANPAILNGILEWTNVSLEAPDVE